MKWFILALIAVLFWSGSDFFSKLGSPAEDRFSHWKMVRAVGLVMGLHAAYMVTAGGVTVTARDFLVYLPASFCYILSMIIGYVGLRYIELSISSPVCNSSGAVSCILCALFLGQRMIGLQICGVILICGGILLLEIVNLRLDDERKNAPGQYRNSAKAVMLPVLYCLIDGLGTFLDAWLLDGHIGEAEANCAYEFTFFGMAVFAFCYLKLVKKQRILVSGDSFRRLELPKLAGAVCETAGQFAYIYALSANAVLAAPMISAYCLVSMIWSRIFLKERLSRGQYLAIGIAVAGIIVLGFTDA